MNNSYNPVYFYIPNIIGYIRIVFALMSIFLLPIKDFWHIGIIFYIFSFICDVFDGFAARYFNQSTKFGAILDMITDRLSTSSLLFILSILYPKYYIFFNLILILDISSHWVKMISSENHHKDIFENKDHLITSIYYQNYYFFGYCCIGTELFYLILIVLYFETTISLALRNFLMILFIFSLPSFIFKQIVNFIQLKQSFKKIAANDFQIKNKNN